MGTIHTVQLNVGTIVAFSSIQAIRRVHCIPQAHSNSIHIHTLEVVIDTCNWSRTSFV